MRIFRRRLFHASFFNSIDSLLISILELMTKNSRFGAQLKTLSEPHGLLFRTRKKMKTWSTWWDTTEIIWRKIASYRSCRRWLAKRKHPHRVIIWWFPRSSKLWGWYFQKFFFDWLSCILCSQSPQQPISAIFLIYVA